MEPTTQTPQIKFVDVTDTEPEEKKLKFQKSFQIEYTDPETGHVLIGVFTCHRLTLREIGQVGIIKARLNGGEKLDAHIDFMNEMLAYCQVALSKTPEWWHPEEDYEAALLRKVYDYVRAWENSFRK